MPKYSIMLPTHNRADVVGFAIKSVQAQTEKSWELMVVGDGCTDNTAKVVKKFAKKDKRIKWFNFPKGKGFGYDNRNKAFKKMKGKYVAFMAHDDLIFSDHLELLGKQLDADESVDIAYSRPFWVDRSGRILTSNFNLNHPRTFKWFMKEGNAIPASCFMHRREMFDKVGFWNEKLLKSGDWEFWKRIIRYGKNKNFAFCPEGTTLHFVANWRSDNTTSWEAIISRMARSMKLIPRGLTIKVPKGMTEQEAFWKEMTKSQPNWESNIRKLSQAQTDALAYYGTMTLRDEVMFKEQHGASVVELEAQIDELQSSAAYKLRRTYRKVVKPGSTGHKVIGKAMRAPGKIVPKKKKS